MKLEFLAVCDYVAEFGGKLTIVGTFDRINGPGVPIQLPTMGIALKFRMQANDPPNKTYKLEVRFKAPNGQMLFNMSGDMTYQADPSSTPPSREMDVMQMHFMAMRPAFPLFGKYMLEVWLDRTLAGAAPVFVVQTFAPAAGPPAPGGPPVPAGPVQ